MSDRGDASAQYHLGYKYDTGSGVAQDYAQALICGFAVPRHCLDVVLRNAIAANIIKIADIDFCPCVPLISSLAKPHHRLGEVLRNSLPDGKKDLVVLSQSLHHVEDPRAVLREAARILKPGGKVTLLELSPHEESWVLDRLGHRHLGFEPAFLEAALRKEGFGSIDREEHARDSTSPFRVFRLTGVKR